MPSTFTSLHYHLVFGTKNREPFLMGDNVDATHRYLAGCFKRMGGVPLRIGGVADHVHALVRLKPTHCVADVLREIKKASSEWLRPKLPRFHWQDGYSAFTVAKSQLADVDRYIAGQAEHHRKRTFENEYRDLLRAHEIEFNERFLL